MVDNEHVLSVDEEFQRLTKDHRDSNWLQGQLLSKGITRESLYNKKIYLCSQKTALKVKVTIFNNQT